MNKTFPQDGIYTGTLTVTDNAGSQSVKPINIVIANRAPTANNDTGLNTTENAVLNIAASSILGNDTDPSPLDVLSISSVNATSTLGASVILNANGTVTYDPNSSSTLNALRNGVSQVDSFVMSLRTVRARRALRPYSLRSMDKTIYRRLLSIRESFPKTLLQQRSPAISLPMIPILMQEQH